MATSPTVRPGSRLSRTASRLNSALYFRRDFAIDTFSLPGASLLLVWVSTFPGEDHFSRSASIYGARVLVGASEDDDACPEVPNSLCNSGAAYLFELAPDTTQFCSCPFGGSCGNADDYGGCSHSMGHGAILSAGGPTSVAADTLLLEARWLPPHKPGVLFMGGAYSAPTPFGDGGLCVQPGLAGLFRFTPPQSSGSEGVMTWGPGLIAGTGSNPPAGQISAGQTWYFQTWFRDPSGPCGLTYNLSSGLRVVFTP